jgi:enoyl-CoA hydratase/carnithine racemase
MTFRAAHDLTIGRDKGERVPGVSRTDNLRLILRANELLAGFPWVSVTVVRGRALGFGTVLALHSDIALAADTAVLGFDELAHGLPPLVVLTYLYRHVLPKTADELVLTGRRLGAVEALWLGLVSRLVPEGDLDAVAERTVAELGGRDPSALRLLKEFAREAKDPASQRFGKDAGEYAVERLVGWIEGARA